MQAARVPLEAAPRGVNRPDLYALQVAKASAKASTAARNSLCTMFLNRQLKADRILTLSNHSLETLNFHIRWDYLACLSSRERREARARGFTRIWKRDRGTRNYFLRDKERNE